MKTYSLILVCFLSSLSLADSMYALVVYGYQNRVNAPRASHSFGSFIEVPNDGSALKVHTISWLPANGNVRPLALLPERGFNFSLGDTFRFAAREGSFIKRWGPVRISPELFHAGVARMHYLNSGSTSYKVLDGMFRRNPSYSQPGGAVNCIHAISDVGGFLDTGTLRGWAASELVFKHLTRARSLPEDLEWMVPSLGVQSVPRADRLLP